MAQPPIASYQVSIPVKLSEEDRCLYSRLGLGYFNVRNIADDTIDPTAQPLPYVLPFHASITSIDIDNCDCTKAIFHLFVQLPEVLAVRAPIVPPTPPTSTGTAVRPAGQVFIITAGNTIGCHSARILSTVNIAPFPNDTIARGIFNECTSFEMIRVPSREVIPVPPAETQLIVVDPAATPNAIIGGNALAITLPLNYELKCLAPNHTAISVPTTDDIRTKVRVVSCGPVKFSIPALLAYNFTTCTVTLEIDLNYIATNYNTAFIGYEQLFAPCRDGFDNFPADTQTGAIQLLDIINQYIGQGPYIGAANPGAASAKFFQLLSASRKLELMGVDKCANKVLHTFTICYVPWVDFLVSVNCVPRSTQQIPFTSDLPPSQYPGFDANANTFRNGYTVMSECEYSYRYYISTGIPPAF
jgi:hypothetical protein